MCSWCECYPPPMVHVHGFAWIIYNKHQQFPNRKFINVFMQFPEAHTHTRKHGHLIEFMVTV